jgi:hypothetical protein
VGIRNNYNASPLTNIYKWIRQWQRTAIRQWQRTALPLSAARKFQCKQRDGEKSATNENRFRFSEICKMGATFVS